MLRILDDRLERELPARQLELHVARCFHFLGRAEDRGDGDLPGRVVRDELRDDTVSRVRRKSVDPLELLPHRAVGILDADGEALAALDHIQAQIPEVEDVWLARLVRSQILLVDRLAVQGDA